MACCDSCANSAPWDCGHSGLGGLNGQKNSLVCRFWSARLILKRLARDPIKKSQDRTPIVRKIGAQRGPQWRHYYHSKSCPLAKILPSQPRAAALQDSLWLVAACRVAL